MNWDDMMRIVNSAPSCTVVCTVLAEFLFQLVGQTYWYVHWGRSEITEDDDDEPLSWLVPTEGEEIVPSMCVSLSSFFMFILLHLNT